MSAEMLQKYSELINRALLDYLPNGDCSQGEVINAMRYSLEAGGKRLRPALVLEFCRVCGGDFHDGVACACAIEMIHTYSLIHDDLPCMDNDDFRRGKPSCHKAFGEDTALLAGDALQSLAFETALKTPDNVPKQFVLMAMAELAGASGAMGMVGGQVIDLKSEGQPVESETLLHMYSLKTGKLIECAAVMGCMIAGGNAVQISAARSFAQNIGAAFQIRDDILDAVGDATLIGKPIGSDMQNNKTTFASLVGIEASNRLTKDYTVAAKKALEPFGDKAESLKLLADYLATRNN